MRPIDADVLIAYCKEIAKDEWNKRSAPVSWSDAYEGFIDTIEETPTIDAVPVVRCKDCAHAKKNYLVNGLCLCEKPIYAMGKGEIPRNELMAEDDFCSSGERRNEDG